MHFCVFLKFYKNIILVSKHVRIHPKDTISSRENDPQL